MAYTTIPLADIAAGKPTKEEIFDTIRSNQEQFNTDIQALQQTAKIDIFDIQFGSYVSQHSGTDISAAIPVFKAPVAATMVSFVVTLLEASTSGTLEISLDKSTDNGINWTPLLNNPVQVTTSTVGSISGTVDWVDVPSQSFAQNDLLRITVDTIQLDQGAFHVSIYGELS